MDTRTQRLLLAIISLAILLRLFGLSQYPLHGDEYLSIAKAKSFGLNAQGMSYFIVLHPWMRIDDSEFWLRALASIFAILTIPFIFRIGKEVSGTKTGLIASLFVATSPFHIYHSQEVRFYTVFIFSTTLFVFYSLQLLEPRHRPLRILAAAASGLLLIFSHVLGVLVIAAQLAVLWTERGKPKNTWKRTVIVIALLMIAFALPLSPIVYQSIWKFYQSAIAVSDAQVQVITPITPLSVVKLGMAVYFFFFGYHVYPLKFLIVIPGIVLLSIGLIIGMYRTIENKKWTAIPFIYATLMVGTYVALESIGGRLAGGVAPRHVAFVWPVFVIIFSIGLAEAPKMLSYLGVVMLVLLNLASLWMRWDLVWTYSDKVDYRAAANNVSDWITNNSVLLHDGRSQNPINYYFPANIPWIINWEYVEGRDLDDLSEANRLIFVTNDFQAERRVGFNHLLNKLNERYSWTDGRVEYPFFVYVYDKKPTLESTYSIFQETRQVRQPLEIYGIEFKDLQLPIKVQYEDIPLVVVGAFSLANLDGADRRQLIFDDIIDSDEIVLLSTLIEAETFKPGEQIAELIIRDSHSNTRYYPIRFGEQTHAWDRSCDLNSNCDTVYQWHKHIALVGQNSYPGAWRDFQAGLHATSIPLKNRISVESIEFNYTAKVGRLYIWGVVFSR